MLSVTGIRNFLGKRMAWIMVFLSFALLASMGLYFGRGGGFEGGGYGEMEFAVVNGRKITLAEFEQRLRAATEEAQRTQMRMTPDATFNVYRSVVTDLVRDSVVLTEAQKQGIRVDDRVVMNVFDKGIGKYLEQLREQYVAEKKLKEGASKQELLEVFRKETGRRWETVVAEQRAQLEEDLRNPGIREKRLAAAAFSLISERIEERVPATEAAYRKAREQLTMRRILVHEAKHVDPKARIEEVQRKLKEGADFDQLAEEYSDEQPGGLPGAPLKKGEMSPIDRGSLTYNPVLKSLADKPVGFVSDVIQLPGEGYAIYKIKAAKPKLPDDFEQRKSFYLQKFKEEVGRFEVQEFQRQLFLNAKVEFKEPAWHLIYKLVDLDWRVAFGAVQMSPQERNKQYLGLLDEATAIVKAKKGVTEPATLMRLYLARVLAGSPDIQDLKVREKLQATLREAILDVLKRFEDPELRDALVQEFIREKNYAAAIAQLSAMSRYAYDPRSPSDQQIHYRVQNHLSLIKAAGYDSPELKKLEEAEQKYQERARQARLEQMRRQEEEQRRAEERRKQAEERRAAREREGEQQPRETKPAPSQPGG